MVKKIPTKLEKHGHVRVDDYYWLRERENPEVIGYLNEENAYAAKEMAHAREFEEKLFAEIKGRFKQTDMSVPYKRDDYFYYTRYEEGKEYPIYARRRGSLDQPEEIMLDANILAAGHEFFSIGGSAVSAGQDILAYAVDTQGRRIHTAYLKNLTTGEMLADVLPTVTENLAWANDNKTLFYGKQDETTLRQYQIYRHVVGTDPADDELVFEENDETFVAYIFKTKSKKFLMIVSSQTVSQEYRYLEADNPRGTFKIFLPREREHEYHIEHFEDRFLIRTNDQAKNFRLMSTPVDKPEREHWREIIPHREDVYLGDFELFKNYLVLEERARAMGTGYATARFRFNALAYDNPVNQQSGFGTIEELNRATVEEVRKFYQTYYTPSNAGLVLVGDFDSGKARERIQHRTVCEIGGELLPEREQLPTVGVLLPVPFLCVAVKRVTSSPNASRSPV